jgi:putative lipoprotein
VVGTDDGLDVEVTDETISGDTGCNRFHGPYRVDGPTMSIGPLAATRRAGSPAEMEQERAILAAFASVTGWHLASDRIDLLRADGGIALVLTRAPSA